MSFADPAVLTVNAVAKSLVKINQDKYSSEYRLRGSGEEFRLNIRNSSYVDKRRGSIKIDRHNVEFIHEVYPVAPATRSTIRKAYFVFENDPGDTLVDPVYVASALCAFLTASTNANLVRLTNAES